VCIHIHGDTLRVLGAMPVRVHMDDTGRMVNRKNKTDKTKTDTNPIPDLDKMSSLYLHFVTLHSNVHMYRCISEA